MAQPTVSEPPVDEDPYNSASDDDFNPSVLADEGDSSASSSSASDAETVDQRQKLATKKRMKRKRAPVTRQADELDSGDEVTIKERAKLVKRRKVKFAGTNGEGAARSMNGEDLDAEDDEGGEGGFVKTRSQMRTEERERKPLASTIGSSIDVDALWSSMTAVPVGKSTNPDSSEATTAPYTKSTERIAAGPAVTPGSPLSRRVSSGADAPTDGTVVTDESMITIKRTYEFAGETVHEERRVPKDSAEARLYLSSLRGDGSKATEDPVNLAQSGATTPQAGSKPLRRPLRRPSRFDPNPTGEVKGLPPELQRRWWQDSKDQRGIASALGAASGIDNAGPASGKATKLNTVEKSKLDWVKHVDKEGLQEELDEYGRAKEGYLGRMEFLNRVEGRREDEYRNVKSR